MEKNIKKKEDRFIVNCASQEYFKVSSHSLSSILHLFYYLFFLLTHNSPLPPPQAIDPKIVGYPIITITLPGPAIFAKRGRGAFVRFAVMENVKNLDELENFTG